MTRLEEICGRKALQIRTLPESHLKYQTRETRRTKHSCTFIWTFFKPSGATMFNRGLANSKIKVEADDIGVPRGIKTLVVPPTPTPTHSLHRQMHSDQTLSLEEKKSHYSHQLAEHTLRQWQSVRREQEGISWPISRTKQSTRCKSSTRFTHPKLSVASRNAGDGKDPSEGNKLDSEQVSPAIDCLLMVVKDIRVVDYGLGKATIGKSSDANPRKR
ncbi:hypothetical protein EV368DRAFT_62115 [Lentinula lateritia]|nr:hypothetical protein EV368DRAFT_62115 [Lentinula lateritia]